jgi:hypothetical protein
MPKEGLVTLISDLIKDKLEILEKKSTIENTDLNNLDLDMKKIEGKIKFKKKIFRMCK